ncbi:MAG: VCBS repeat-containing protein, partial [Bacteroidota bacterium]
MIRSIITGCLVLLIGVGCQEAEQKQNPKTTQPNTVVKEHPGKALHDLYCGTCHQVPSPRELDKKTWKNHILVRMGAYMGIYNDNARYYDQVPDKWVEPGEGGERVMAANIYPKNPVVKRAQWEQIHDYIMQTAPDKTTGNPKALPIEKSLPQFKTHLIQPEYMPDSTLQPFVTAIEIDEAGKKMYAGFYKQGFVEMDSKGKFRDMIQDGVIGPVYISKDKGRLTVADIGSMGGSDRPQGLFYTGKSFSALKKRKYGLRLNRLQRPVHATWADLDADGDEDLLLCEFGYHLGEFAWHENDGKGNFTRHTLFPDDGAVSAAVHDFNADGLPEVTDTSP